MRIILIGLLLTLAFLAAVLGADTGKFYDEMLGTVNEVPDPSYYEFGAYLFAGICVIMAVILRWFEDRSLYRRREQTFFPSAWLFIRKGGHLR